MFSVLQEYSTVGYIVLSLYLFQQLNFLTLHVLLQHHVLQLTPEHRFILKLTLQVLLQLSVVVPKSK